MGRLLRRCGIQPALASGEFRCCRSRSDGVRTVLISDRVRIWRQVEAARAGLVVPDNIDGVQELLGPFLRLPDDGKRLMGSAARQCFIDKFEVEHAAAALLRIIEQEIDR
jgi:hypothetical protein